MDEENNQEVKFPKARITFDTILLIIATLAILFYVYHSVFVKETESNIPIHYDRTYIYTI